MAKFLALRKDRMKNSMHYDFVESFITVCTAHGFEAEKILTLLAALQAKFADEDALYMHVRASDVIARRQEADKRRDLMYGRLHRLVLVWAGTGIANLDDAATELKKIFDLYKLDTRAQINEESGAMTNLASDLSTTENLARIETIGGTALFNAMVAANEQVKSLRLEEGIEESQKVSEALKKARKATDEAYDALCDKIEGGASFADDPTPYTTFIDTWNGTISLYREALNGHTTASEDDDNNGGSTDNGGSTGNGGSDSGNGSGSGDNGGSGSGSGSGSGDNGGSGSGSGSGSGDNGGGDNGGGSGDNGGGGSDWGNGSDE